MRTYYVRRKDLSHVPFQFYVTSDGTARPLDKGYTSTFAITPTKQDFDVIHVHIVQEWANEMQARWDISEPDWVRVAAKALEVWLKDGPILADHFYGPDMLKVDQAWCPMEPDGSPSVAVDPYSFCVASDEPWPSILDWHPSLEHAQEAEATTSVEEKIDDEGKIVFGFTMDVFPGLLLIGCEQFKHKAAAAGLNMPVQMTLLGELPSNTQVLFVPSELEEVAHQVAPQARVQPLDELVNVPIYDAIIQELVLQQQEKTRSLEHS